jgi:quinol monooxygenase YgiN
VLKVIAQDLIEVAAIDTVMPLYRELVVLTRQEPRNISYDLYVDRDDPGHFVFVETWPDQEALDEHCASEHFRRLVPQIDAFQRGKDTDILMAEAFPDLAREPRAEGVRRRDDVPAAPPRSAPGPDTRDVTPPTVS